MNTIKVSIITVVYNGEKYLEQTIMSVLSQNYSNIEYIIIDGGSTDGTLGIIKKYENKLAYWISEKDNGIYDAMNKGIQHATGELIGLINSDDYYEPNSVSSIMNTYLKNGKPDVLFGDMKLINTETNQSKIIFSSESKLNRDMTLNHPTCFVRKILYTEKLFDSSFKICADYDFITYMYKHNKSFKYIPEIIACMRIGGASDNFILSTKEVFIVQKKYFGLGLGLANILIRYSKRIFKIFIQTFLSVKIVETLKGFK